MKNLLVNRVAFTLFGQDIYWYGIIITFAIMLDFVLLLILSKKRAMPKDLPYDMVFVLIPAGIIGARFFACLFDADLTLLDFFAFRDGGMSIIGAVIFGAISLFIYSKIKKVDFFEIADLIAPLLILAQSIGRWGNYFNGEVYGKEIVNVALQWFPLAVQIGDKWYQALFFYESILNIIGFALIMSLFFIKKRKKGILIATYFVYYGIVRFFMETLRQEQFIYRVLGLPMSKMLAGLFVLCGLAIFGYYVIKYFIDKRNNKLGVINGK